MSVRLHLCGLCVLEVCSMSGFLRQAMVWPDLKEIVDEPSAVEVRGGQGPDRGGGAARRDFDRGGRPAGGRLGSVGLEVA